jgi:hypothetical protein
MRRLMGGVSHSFEVRKAGPICGNEPSALRGSKFRGKVLYAPRGPGPGHVGCLNRSQTRDALLCEIQELAEELRT